MATTTHSAVLAAMAAQITAIDATDYEQGTLGETWTEAISPFEDAATSLPDSIAHLGFAVFLASSRPSRGTRQDDEDTMEVESEIHVVWTYRLRHDSQVADYRKALDSSEAVVAALLDESWSSDATPLVVECAQPAQIEGEPWLLIRASFLISYTVGV